MIVNQTAPELIKEIVSVTSKIRSNYPELHKQLVERAATFKGVNKDNISTTDLEKHLERLKVYLNHRSQTLS